MSQGHGRSITAKTGESVSPGRSKKREDRTVNGALHLTNNNPGRIGPGSQALLIMSDDQIDVPNAPLPFITLDTYVYSA